MGFIVAISAYIFKSVELLPPKFLMERFVVLERGSNGKEAERQGQRGRGGEESEKPDYAKCAI